MEQLEVTLLGISVLVGGFGGAESFTLSLDEHEEFPCNRVLLGKGQGSVLADEHLQLQVAPHGLVPLFPPAWSAWAVPTLRGLRHADRFKTVSATCRPNGGFEAARAAIPAFSARSASHSASNGVW